MKVRILCLNLQSKRNLHIQLLLKTEIRILIYKKILWLLKSQVSRGEKFLKIIMGLKGIEAKELRLESQFIKESELSKNKVNMIYIIKL